MLQLGTTSQTGCRGREGLLVLLVKLMQPGTQARWTQQQQQQRERQGVLRRPGRRGGRAAGPALLLLLVVVRVVRSSLTPTPRWTLLLLGPCPSSLCRWVDGPVNTHNHANVLQHADAVLCCAVF